MLPGVLPRALRRIKAARSGRGDRRRLRRPAPSGPRTTAHRRRQEPEASAQAPGRAVVVDPDPKRRPAADGRDLEAHLIAPDDDQLRRADRAPHLAARRVPLGDHFVEGELQAEGPAALADVRADRLTLLRVEGVGHAAAPQYQGRPAHVLREAGLIVEPGEHLVRGRGHARGGLLAGSHRRRPVAAAGIGAATRFLGVPAANASMFSSVVARMRRSASCVS